MSKYVNINDTSTMSITLYLSLTSSPSSPRVSISVPQDPPATGADLRKLASSATTIPLTSMKLIYRGRVIADKETGDIVKEFSLENESVIHVMGKPTAAANNDGDAELTAPSATAVPTATGASVTVPTTRPTAPTTDASPVDAALMTLRTTNSSDVYRTALSTADKLLQNIITHPMEEKYRTVKKSNPAFNKRLGGVSGGEALLLSAGFTIETEEGNEVYVLRPSAQAWPRLVAVGEEVKRRVAENNNQSNISHPSGTPTTGASNNGLFGGVPRGGEMNATMQQMMMNDPNMMQNMVGMMNNPMVQNMMRNDPRFANNPMVQQALDALQSNPGMVQQVSQMMNDPAMRANMSRMMQQQSDVGGAPFGGNGSGDLRRQMEEFQRMSQQFAGASGSFNSNRGGAPPASSQSGNDGANSQNDDEMTEEEMIAEAIRRSLAES